MNAGLPTTGIGGMFYVFCTFLMVLNESVLSLRGKSSKKRWGFVSKHFILVAAILVTVFFTDELFNNSGSLIPVFLIPLLILGFITVFMQILRSVLAFTALVRREGVVKLGN